MFGSSMVLTVGAALDRAQSEGLQVRLHVGGEWLSGMVVNHDGHGVALLEDSGDVCVLRPEAISGVRIPQQSEATAAPSPRRHPLERAPIAV